MKIGILTHHTVINQGAIMQMYAMNAWLTEKGHDVYFLKYTKDFDFAPNEAGKYNLSLKYFPFYFKEYVIKKGVGLSWFNVKKQLMYKKYIPATFKFKQYALDKMDTVIVGSDEVFSLANGCNMMMYGHGVNTDCLISYAPSFGQTDINTIKKFHCEKLISSGLKMFKSLSVRDKPSADVVEELIGRRPNIVSDPVLMYDFKNEHADISRFHLKDKKYLLIYSMDRWMVEPEEVTAIRDYAKSNGMITVSAGTYHKWCDKNIVCNPIEWLEIYRGATQVITDTFHGAMLSIIEAKDMAFFIRDLNSNKLNDLIYGVGLQERICAEITKDEIERVFQKGYDKDLLRKRISEKRNYSQQYLISALEK